MAKGNSKKLQKLMIVIILAIIGLAYNYRDRLNLPIGNKAPSGYSHDKWKTSPADITRKYQAFIVSFDGKDDDDGDGKSDLRGQPEWVAYQLSRHDGDLGKGAKRPGWTTDKGLYKGGIAPNDATYKNSGFDRGHMCQKYHAFRIGKEADRETHTMLNACPQIHDFNAGIWLDLEQKCGKWADLYGAVWIVCGPVFDKGGKRKTIGDKEEMRIPVPDKFFKLVIREKGDGVDVMAFIYPHKDVWKTILGRKYDHSDFLVSVDDVEAVTGLDFLTSLPDEIEAEVEGVKSDEVWAVR